jgi:hypothetical protein
MKAVIALIVAALVLIPTAATAASAAKDPRVPALQREVKALQAQVSQNATALNQQMDQSTCKWAYQSHFNFGVLNIFALMLGQPQLPTRQRVTTALAPVPESLRLRGFATHNVHRSRLWWACLRC